jgi:hypothetical protein
VVYLSSAAVTHSVSAPPNVVSLYTELHYTWGLTGQLVTIMNPFYFAVVQGDGVLLPYLQYLSQIRHASLSAFPFLDPFFPELGLQSARNKTLTISNAVSQSTLAPVSPAPLGDPAASVSPAATFAASPSTNQAAPHTGPMAEPMRRAGGKGPREASNLTTGPIEQKFSRVKSAFTGILLGGQRIRLDALVVLMGQFLSRCHNAVLFNWLQLAHTSMFAKDKRARSQLEGLQSSAQQLASAQRKVDEVRCAMCLDNRSTWN